MTHDRAPTCGGKVKCQVATPVTPRLPSSHRMTNRDSQPRWLVIASHVSEQL